MQNTAVALISDLCKESLPCHPSEEEKKQMVFNLGREIHFTHTEKKNPVLQWNRFLGDAVESPPVREHPLTT